MKFPKTSDGVKASAFLGAFGAVGMASVNFGMVGFFGGCLGAGMAGVFFYPLLKLTEDLD